MTTYDSTKTIHILTIGGKTSTPAVGGALHRIGLVSAAGRH